MIAILNPTVQALQVVAVVQVAAIRRDQAQRATVTKLSTQVTIAVMIFSIQTMILINVHLLLTNVYCIVQIQSLN